MSAGQLLKLSLGSVRTIGQYLYTRLNFNSSVARTCIFSKLLGLQLCDTRECYVLIVSINFYTAIDIFRVC